MVNSRTNPFTALATLLVIAGAWGMLTRRAGPDAAPARCDAAADPLCEAAGGGDGDGGLMEAALRFEGPVLPAAEACRNVGYLCADLARTDRVRLHRWRDFTGPMVVHIPRPDFEDAAQALALQQAASVGVGAWNGQPFEVVTDRTGDRSPHFAIHWVRGLGGNQIGVARTQWSSMRGLSILSIELVTRSPFDGSPVDPHQVRLTAAHEMGHALGLPHSDSPRDVMYPTNTATSLTAQDYRTMESLYRLPDGAEIVR